MPFHIHSLYHVFYVFVELFDMPNKILDIRIIQDYDTFNEFY